MTLTTIQLGFHFSPFLATSKKLLSRRVCAKPWRNSMFVSLKLKPVLKDGTLTVSGRDALTEVPDNVVVTPLTSSSAFVGASSEEARSRHVFKLGVIRYVVGMKIQGTEANEYSSLFIASDVHFNYRDVRMLCLFRFKLWWMIPRVGNSGSDVPAETQMLLIESRDDPNETCYVLFLPLLDGQFRSSLQGSASDDLEFCVESGDPAIVTTESLKAVFVNCGNNPFELMHQSIKILEKHFGTFAHRESKQMPGMLDYFGWCTWDAFYHQVHPEGIREGLKSLAEGGTPAKFLIIDDGWQDVSNEFQKEGEPIIDGSQFGGRLESIKENTKFRRESDKAETDSPSDLNSFISEIKSSFGLKYVYMWHALLGYWGGLSPNAPGTEKYRPKMTFPHQSPGNLANKRDLAMDCMEEYGIGVIEADKIHDFLNDLHRYLVSQGVDGVKVDVQNILETISAGLGGRVSLTKRVQKALEDSIAANFRDNSIICCMGMSNDSLFHSKRSAITRASDDYYPKNPATQTLHVASVAYNSIFLGEVVVPDWDMFYSLHDAAEFHAAARSVGGCGIYVSDKPGHHDFEILKRLVLPDGSVLRAQYPGRPTRDCLFVDPVMDGANLLKIWNMNKCTGVIGVFNCQGAGAWPCLKTPVQSDLDRPQLSGKVSPSDIEYLEQVSGTKWTKSCAIFSFRSGSLSRVQQDQHLDVTLKVLECDVLTVSPIKVYDNNIEFAAIGLLNMYNSGGAVETVDFFGDESNREIRVKGRGVGRFGAYSSAEPKSCSVNSKSEEFRLRSEDNLLTLTIQEEDIYWEITVCY